MWWTQPFRAGIQNHADSPCSHRHNPQPLREERKERKVTHIKTSVNLDIPTNKHTEHRSYHPVYRVYHLFGHLKKCVEAVRKRRRGVEVDN